MHDFTCLFASDFQSNACDFSKLSLGFLVLDGELGHHKINLKVFLLGILLLSDAFQRLQSLSVLVFAHADCRYGSPIESDTFDCAASWSGLFSGWLVDP